MAAAVLLLAWCSNARAVPVGRVEYAMASTAQTYRAC
jgi:hypothetical protein